MRHTCCDNDYADLPGECRACDHEQAALDSDCPECGDAADTLADKAREASEWAHFHD